MWFLASDQILPMLGKKEMPQLVANSENDFGMEISGMTPRVVSGVVTNQKPWTDIFDSAIKRVSKIVSLRVN